MKLQCWVTCNRALTCLVHASFNLRFLVILTVNIRHGLTLQMNLLDTTTMESLDWVTHWSGDESVGRMGWREASYTDQAGDVYRIYTVCNVDSANVNNWLRIPYVATPLRVQTTTRSGGGAESGVKGRVNYTEEMSTRLYVEMNFTTRQCLHYPDPSRLQQCRESFKLMRYDAGSDFANSMMPTWDEATYTYVDVIAADQVFSDTDSSVINSETRSVIPTRLGAGGGGTYFAFYDQGACLSLLSVRIYHIVCPAVVTKLVQFDETWTGPELASVVETVGWCVRDAVPLSASEIVGTNTSRAAGDGVVATYLCMADGSWSFLTGRGCTCRAGYRADDWKTSCTPCGAHTYRSVNSDLDICLPCPAHSTTHSTGSAYCTCIFGYYRSDIDPIDAPCTGPPGGPVENLTITEVTDATVSLSWLPPSDGGGRSDIVYRVTCVEGCPIVTNDSSNVIFLPAPMSSYTHVTAYRLTDSTSYIFTVYAENGVSRQSGIVQSANISFTTYAPRSDANLRVTSTGSDYVSLVWNPMSSPNLLEADMYEINYWPVHELMKNVSKISVVVNDGMSVTVRNLKRMTRYAFVVRSRTLAGESGEFSNEVYAVTDDYVEFHASSRFVVVTVGSVSAVVICLAVSLVFIIFCMVRYGRACHKKTSDRNDDIIYNNAMFPLQCSESLVIRNHGVTAVQQANNDDHLQLYSRSPTLSTSGLNPPTYEDISDSMTIVERRSTVEIDTSQLTVEEIVCKDWFGNIWKGRLKVAGFGDKLVEIKMVEADSLRRKWSQVFSEASLVAQFDDTNVIRLLGVVSKSRFPMIVSEFMPNGSLRKFLNENVAAKRLTMLQLVGIIRGIASGMNYLCQMGYIHGTEYDTNRKRWTAPEVLSKSDPLSWSSDVWSYGIVMWEVMSGGAWPYSEFLNTEFVLAVLAGYRLPLPKGCPELIYRLMLDSWQQDRLLRPTFFSIVQSLDELAMSPYLLRTISGVDNIEFAV